jgi:hypothetical protein
MEQYMLKNDLLAVTGVIDTSKFEAISRDSYSDVEVLKTIKQKKGLTPLFYAALQTSIVGFGNKSFGEFKLDEENVDVLSVYKEFGVKSDLQQGAKLSPGDLTPRRLQRFYRFQISQYIVDNENVYPYLWKKYSNLDVKFRHITFPGAESMIETPEEAKYLLETYSELDTRIGTNICERIKRVLLARKIISLM